MAVVSLEHWRLGAFRVSRLPFRGRTDPFKRVACGVGLLRIMARLTKNGRSCAANINEASAITPVAKVGQLMRVATARAYGGDPLALGTVAWSSKNSTGRSREERWCQLARIRHEQRSATHL